MRLAVIALMILPALANRISVADRQNIAGDDSIVAEERELQEEFPIAEETDYMSQRQEGEQTAVLPEEAFGLKREDLEKLYKMWLATVPSGGDSSVSAFLQWMKESNAEDEQLGPGQQSIAKWWKKLWDQIVRKKSRRTVNDETVEAEKELPEEFPIAGNYMSQRQENELNADYLSKAFGLKREDLEKLYKMWLATVPSGGDSSVSAFLQWMKESNAEDEQLGPGQQSIAKWWKKLWDQIVRKKSRRTVNDETVEAEKELPEEFPIAGNYMSQRQENELNADYLSKVEETRAGKNEKSEAFDCETNSPCTADNIAKELFYFAAKDPNKFVQCSAFGSCSEMSCQRDLRWDDKDKACSYKE